VPEKLERCVSDVKAKGMSDDSAWGICVDSTGEKPHKEAKIKEKDYPWGQCTSDQQKDGKDKNSADKICGSIKAKYGETNTIESKIKEQIINSKIYSDHKKGIKEKVNENRQVPFSNPKIKSDKVEPENRKTTKGIGGKKLDKDSFLWKDIFDAQLKQNVKEPKA